MGIFEIIQKGSEALNENKYFFGIVSDEKTRVKDNPSVIHSWGGLGTSKSFRLRRAY